MEKGYQLYPIRISCHYLLPACVVSSYCVVFSLGYDLVILLVVCFS